MKNETVLNTAHVLSNLFESYNNGISVRANGNNSFVISIAGNVISGLMIHPQNLETSKCTHKYCTVQSNCAIDST